MSGRCASSYGYLFLCLIIFLQFQRQSHRFSALRAVEKMGQNIVPLYCRLYLYPAAIEQVDYCLRAAPR